MQNLTGQNIIVTGGASGIGAATARAAIKAGATVAITDLSEDQGSELAVQLGKGASSGMMSQRKASGGTSSPNSKILQVQSPDW